MAFQPSVVEYFNNRKRPAADDLKKGLNPSKVLVLDSSPVIDSLKEGKDISQNTLVRKLVYTNKEVILPTKKPKTTSRSKSGQNFSSKGKKIIKPDGNQMDIRKTLLNIVNKKTTECSKDSFNKDTSAGTLKEELDGRKNEKAGGLVPFHILGPLDLAGERGPRMWNGTSPPAFSFFLPSSSSFSVPADVSLLKLSLEHSVVFLLTMFNKVFLMSI
uniref:Uncharacterized protein n=2 Tax=Graphocephala atropunctata TaxID=36148 RepID=A0A1B6M0Y9_9HEMI